MSASTEEPHFYPTSYEQNYWDPCIHGWSVENDLLFEELIKLGYSNQEVQLNDL